MRRIVVVFLCCVSVAAHAQRILVQPRPGVTQADLDSKLAAVRGKRVDHIHQIDVHIVELPDTADPRAAAALLRADKRDINFAEVDERVAPGFVPNDPGLASEWYATKLGAQTAWNSASGAGVVVAILDSGVDPLHRDLAANLVHGYNFYDNNVDTRDVYGHGTKVAGTVAMVANNLTGGAGIAFAAQIMPIRVTDTSGYGYYSAMAKGITWAADNGARAANLSFRNVCGSSTIHSAANYMRSKGGIVTAAAGNTGVLESLAASDSITCVSATDSADNRTSWSSYGAYVDVAAPGAGIYTAVSGGSYGSVSGTSFSAPITAAVYALMMSVNTALTPAQLDAILFSTAKDLGTAGKDPYFGHGRIDAAAAVAKANMAAPLPNDTTAPTVGFASPQSGVTVTGTIAVNVNATDNVGISRVDLYAGGALVASDTTSPYAFSWNTASRADGSVVLEARARDAAGNVGSQRITVNVANSTNYGGSTPQPGNTNVALASAGAVASASSASAGYPVAAVNDNRRSGAVWGSGGAWQDTTGNAFPDWVQLNFSGAKTIDRVVVYTLQDNYTNPVEPTNTLTFSRYGVVNFTVQGWNGSAWVTLATVVGNNLVKRTVTFPAVSTARIRVQITHALNSFSRITEIEAWTARVPAPFAQYLLEDSGEYGPRRSEWNQELRTRWTAALANPAWHFGNWLDAGGVSQGQTPYATLLIGPQTRVGYVSADVTALVQKWLATGHHRGIYLRSEASTTFTAFAEVRGRMNSDPPRLVVTTTEGVFTIAGMIAGFSTNSRAGTDTRMLATLHKGFVGLAQFDLSAIKGAVQNAELRLYVSNRHTSSVLTLQVMEMDAPFIHVGGDGGPVEHGLAAAVGEENLPSHADVFKAGDFRKQNWITYADSRGILRADKSRPAPLGTFNAVPTDIPGYEVAWFADPDVPGTQFMRASFVHGDGRTYSTAGPSFRGEYNAADLNDPKRSIRQDQRVDAACVRDYIRLKSDFVSTTDGVKIGNGFDARYGYWKDSSGGHWQPTTGNSGAKGTGLKIISARTDAQGRYEYQGHSIRMHVDQARPSGTPYQKYRPVLVMVSHLGPFNYTPPYGTEEIIRAGTVVLEKERMHSVEWCMKMNSVAGPFDALGNGTALRDGVLELWVDGVKRWSKTDFAWRRNLEIGISGEWVMAVHGGRTPPAPGEILHFDLNHHVYAERYIGPHPKRHR